VTVTSSVKVRLVVSSVLMAVVALGCADTPTDRASNDAATELRSALDATLQAESLVVDSVLTFEGRRSESRTTYVRPNRFETTFPEQDFSRIIIGEDHFITGPDPDTYSHVTFPCGASLPVVLPVFEVVEEAQDVRVEGDEYRFTLGSVDGDEVALTGTVQIDGGRIAFVSLEWAEGREEHALSNFDEPMVIQAPPPDRVIDGEKPSEFLDVGRGAATDCDEAGQP
jgi:hypothetical protein